MKYKDKTFRGREIVLEYDAGICKGIIVEFNGRCCIVVPNNEVVFIMPNTEAHSFFTGKPTEGDVAYHLEPDKRLFVDLAKKAAKDNDVSHGADEFYMVKYEGAGMVNYIREVAGVDEELASDKLQMIKDILD